MKPVTPEAYLHALVRRLKSLDAATTYLTENEREGFAATLSATIRDCQMTSLLHDSTVVAVAGKQGAGKTMLVRMLYDLDTTWLCDNAGRGEYIPVMVLEDGDVSEPQGCIYRWNDETDLGAVRGTPLSAEAFRGAVKSSGSNTLELPVLRVPVRYFGGRVKCGFLLLPGYETITAKNRAWQEFMQMALVACSACVLVTNGDMLAAEQDAILADIRDNELAGVEPVIAITRTEARADDERDELRSAAAERFGVPLECVVCTGTGENYIAAWREQIRDVLNAYGGVGLDARTRQLKDLEGLSRKIGTVVSAARQAVKKSKSAQSDNEELHLDIMEALEEEIGVLRASYRTKLASRFEDLAKAAIGDADADFDKVEGGWSGTGNHIKEFLGRSSDNNRKRMQTRLQAAMVKSGGGAAFATTHAVLLADIAKERLNAPSPALLTIEDRNSSTDVPMIGQDNLVTRQSVAVLQALFSQRRNVPVALAHGQAQEMKQVIKMLPAITLSYMSAMQSAVASHSTSGQTSAVDLRELLADVANTTTELNGLTKSLITAVAGFLIVDVAADGQIDSIAALAKGLLSLFQGPATAIGTTATTAGGAGTTAGTAATMAGTVATAAVGVVTLGVTAAIVTYAVISSLEKQQANGRADIRTAIDNSFSEQLARHLASFDETMSWMKRRLGEQLEIVLRMDENLGHRFRATLAIDDLWEARSRFFDELRARDV